MKSKGNLKVTDFINTIRNSFDDTDTVYCYGGCYWFYTILKAVFPQAKAHISGCGDHILTKLGSKYYDIRWEYHKIVGEELTKKQHKYRREVHRGQRLEYMLQKRYGAYMRPVENKVKLLDDLSVFYICFTFGCCTLLLCLVLATLFWS